MPAAPGGTMHLPAIGIFREPLIAQEGDSEYNRMGTLILIAFPLEEIIGPYESNAPVCRGIQLIEASGIRTAD